MANTYKLISSVTLTSSAATITFSSIPSSYTDLLIDVSARVDASANYQSMAMSFNGGIPASAFTQRWLNSDGSATLASGSYGANTALYPFYLPAATATANTFSNSQIYICGYSDTTKYKSISTDGVTENNATGSGTVRAEFDAMLWSSNNAVTSITLYGNTNFVANSNFYLYGIKNS